MNCHLCFFHVVFLIIIIICRFLTLPFVVNKAFHLPATYCAGFRLCVQVYKCQHSMAAGYLVDLCRPVSSIDSHKHLRSANHRGQLQVPRIRMSTYGSRAFGHAGPSTSNALPDILNSKAAHMLCVLCGRQFIT